MNKKTQVSAVTPRDETRQIKGAHHFIGLFVCPGGRMVKIHRVPCIYGPGNLHFARWPA